MGKVSIISMSHNVSFATYIKTGVEGRAKIIKK